MGLNVIKIQSLQLQLVTIKTLIGHNIHGFMVLVVAY